MNFNLKRKVRQIEEKKQSLLNDRVDLSLAGILETEKCQQLLKQCRPFRDRIYTPFKTVCVFIKQVLSADKSCKKAVTGVVAEHVSTDKKKSASIQAHIVRPGNAYLKQR